MDWLKRTFGWSISRPSSIKPELQENEAERLKAFASLLTTEDFTNASVPGTNAPSANMQDPNSVYLVYAGKSGATGGVELDVFICKSGAASVFETVNAESQDKTDAKISEFGGVKAVMHKGNIVGDSGKFAGLNVMNDDLVFCLAIPDSPNATKQLTQLALLVLERFENLKL